VSPCPALLGPAPRQAPARADADAVRRALDDVLAGAEFRAAEPSLLERFVRWLFERFDFEPDPASLAFASKLVVNLLLAVLALVLVVVLVRVVRAVVRERRARGGGPADDPHALRRRVAELLARAREAKERGDLRLALRLTLFALIVGLGERGDLDYRDAWTNRELLTEGRPSAEATRVLEPLVLELEAKEFGTEPIEPADLARVEGLCERWLGGGTALGGGAA